MPEVPSQTTPPAALVPLRVRGAQVVAGAGGPLRLRGIAVGGWMNMENFITGYPGSEHAQREALLAALGRERYEFFFDKFLEYFFTAADARHLAALGMNVVRLPVNYHHFEDDERPGVITESGFKHLDRVIGLCAREGIYSIIDLHSAPGGQSEDWHCDNATHQALFWRHPHFQDRLVHLWEAFARRYRGNAAVAGYNLLNEPSDLTGARIRPLYQRMIEAIGAIDPGHVIFLDGNHYANDFTTLDPPFENAVYAFHDYTAPGGTGAASYPGTYGGQWFDKARVQGDILRKARYLVERNLPIWAGEFGPHYNGDPVRDALHRQVAADQIDAFDQLHAHWCIWHYKDIGLQGLVHLAPDSPWMTRLKPMLEKKARLAVDGAIPDTAIAPVLKPLMDLLAAEFPGYNPPPWGLGFQVARLVRGTLLAEPLLPEFAALFKDLSLTQIDELMQSFLLERCLKRDALAEILRAACRR